VDLKDPRAMLKADITRIPFVRNAFDIIYCSHVLEHVSDDRKAMHEFYRVLKPNGWAVLQVPITARRTFEDSTITNPIDRTKVFGRYDHVRRYGLDYKARLEEAGFKTTVFAAEDLIENGDDFYRLGVQRDRRVFYCQKMQ
jgi:ubiquinone/menaquinone biosynthesis C-methylase UbiE